MKPATNEPPRILHVATRFRLGGAERNIVHFMEWERSFGFEVELAVGPDSQTDSISDTVRIVPSLVRGVSPALDFRAYRELVSLIGQRGYDMVHTHLSKAGVLGRLAARRRVPRIAHTVHMASFGGGYGKVATLVFRQAERTCAPITDVTAYVGRELRELYLANGIGTPNRSMVIHSPIDIDGFSETRSWNEARKLSVRRDLHLTTRGPVIVAIGTLAPRKRYELMIAKLAPLLIDSPVELAIAGEGDATTLRHAAARFGVERKVIVLGHLDDPTRLIGTADLLVHTAAVEGVPQVVIQALAAGKPVVATEVYGLREIQNAPIRIVPATGDGLADATRIELEKPSRPISIESFLPWKSSTIQREIAAFHGQFHW